jgi:hypothetical protein
MKVELTCDYCHCADQKDLYMITLTGIKNTKNTCSKIICPKCAYHIGTLLDGILDKRDIDETLKEIEGDLLEDDK